jgi:hypothetical protein
MARAIVANDASALRALFSTPVVFRAVTPRRFWDADTSVGVADIVLGTWFGADKRVTDLTLLDVDRLGDVDKVSYRLGVVLDAGPSLVEQVAYYSEKDGQITHMRLVCSGFRRVPPGEQGLPKTRMTPPYPYRVGPAANDARRPPRSGADMAAAPVEKDES